MMTKVSLTILFFLAPTLVTAGHLTGQEKGQLKSRMSGQESGRKTNPAGQDKRPLPAQVKSQVPDQATGRGVSCDCTIFPYKPNPPCPKQCTARTVLATAGIEELILIVGLKADVARRIVSWEGSERPASLEPYRKVLTPEQIRTVEEKLLGLNEAQIKHFHQPVAERTADVKKIKSLLDPVALRRLLPPDDHLAF